MSSQVNPKKEPNSLFSGLQQLLLALLYAGSLSIAFLDSNQYYIAWFAFIPLLLAVENATLVKTFVLGLIAGTVSFVGGTYWIVDFIVISKGFSVTPSLLLAFVYWLYCGLLVAFLLMLFKWLKTHTRVHEFLLFPILVATFTSAYPMLFSMRLGESQTKFYSALQATEFVGVHGLDAIIALFNIILFRFLYQRFATDSKPLHSSKWPWLIGVSLIVLWFVYGVISYSRWEKEIADWQTLKIGIVQPNEIPRLGKRVFYSGYSYAYPPEMEMAERLSSIGAEIVIWPEAQTKGYLDRPQVATAYQENIKTLGSSLLFQDMQHVRDPIDGKLQDQYNSAVMLDDSGQQIGLYRKIKRIPFGEYVPLVGDDSSARQWVESFFGEFLSEISRGKKHQLFKHEKVNIIPLICYETTYPDFVGRAVRETADKADTSNGTVLVGLSNDGWFGSTHQPYEHIMASALRAVENRLPLIHVANNGPSIVVAPNGKVIFTADFQKAGGYITDVPHSKEAQGSFYSRHPNLFDNCLYGFLMLTILYALLAIIYQKKREPKFE